MRVTSSEQRSAWLEGRLPDPEQVRDGLWMVPLPLPGGGMPSSFGYLIVESDGCHIIDTGWNSEDVYDAWVKAAEMAGTSLENLNTVLITHSHPDHIGLAERLRSISGAGVLISRSEDSMMATEEKIGTGDYDGNLELLRGWGVPENRLEELAQSFVTEVISEKPDVDGLLSDGDLVRLGEFQFRVVSTPGHTSGHAVFVDAERKIILTGDHVLPEINPGMGLGTLPGTNPVTDYFTSLEAMREFESYEVLPGHGYRFYGLLERSEQILSHHLKRTREVYELYQNDKTLSVWQIAQRLTWSRGWENMHGFLLLSGLHQTQFHLESIRSGGTDRWIK